MRLGGVEIANSARTRAYMDAGVRPTSTLMAWFHDTWVHTARYLREQDYRVPELDTAPWYDPEDGDSKEFAGVWPFEVEGLDLGTIDREVVEAATNGGAASVPRVRTREITVAAYLVGATPGGVEYGLRWLGRALRGELCPRPSHRGQPLQFLSAIPDTVPDGGTLAEFLDCVDPYEMTAHEVVCTVLPTITERFGVNIESDSRQACIYRVEFTLVALHPFLTRSVRVLAEDLRMPTASAPDIIRFQVGGMCDYQFNATTSALAPSWGTPRVLRPVDIQSTLACEPLESYRAWQVVDASDMVRHVDSAVSFVVSTGAADAKLVRIRVVRLPASVTNPAAQMDLINTLAVTRTYLVADFTVVELPRPGVLSLDSVTGEVTAYMSDSESVLDAGALVVGRNGGPFVPVILSCRQRYIILVDTPGDVDPALSVRITSAVRQL